MHFLKLTFASLAASLAAAKPIPGAPFSPFPLKNGFPNANSSALQSIFRLAGGTPPNGALPTSLTAAATTTLQLLALNELFEVAYFTELLSNITCGVEGYEDGDKTIVRESLTAVINQETVHALAVNAVLTSAGKEAIQPCTYSFPVTNFDDAISLAATFTDVALGVLPMAQAQFAADGGQESALVPIFGGVIGQEGEQDGWYRLLQKKIPSASPFLTGVAAPYAFSALSQFLVACPNSAVIGLTPFPALSVESAPKAENSTLLFSASSSDVTVDPKAVSVAYFSGQNLPVVVPVLGSEVVDGKTFFFAEFPFDTGFSKGLTVGALVKGDASTLKTAADVVGATVAGPALIEVM